MSKKLKSNITSHKAQKLVDEIMSDAYPMESRGNEMLDLIDKDKLNKKELAELRKEYQSNEKINRMIALRLFNEQIKSDGKTDELGSPTSIGLKKALDKAKEKMMNQPIPIHLLEIIENGNKDCSREEAEQILAGLIQDQADEDWNALTEMFNLVGKELGDKVQKVIRKSEKIAKDSVVRKTTKPKASDEQTKNLKKRNKAIRERFFKLTQVYKSKQAFKILENEYNLKYSSLRSIVYKP